MELKVSAFDWDGGNRDKCQKHGLSMSDVDHVLMSTQNLLVRDVQNLLTEDRYIAIGKTRAGRFSFVVFTLRVADDQRFMHKKEIAKYEKEIAGLQNR
jgi:uncharacterized DUF497 family protein